MKRTHFITLFVAANVLFIFLHIHKHIRFVQHSYAKQHLEKQLHDLATQKETLTHELYALQNRTDIKAFAQEKLNMRSIQLQQVEKLEVAS